jgi:hypothetical protein
MKTKMAGLPQPSSPYATQYAASIYARETIPAPCNATCAGMVTLAEAAPISSLYPQATFRHFSHCLDVAECVRRLDVQGNRHDREGLAQALHATMQEEHRVQRRFFPTAAIKQCAAILELRTSENHPLLAWRNAPLALDLNLDIVDRVGRLASKLA